MLIFIVWPLTSTSAIARIARTKFDYPKIFVKKQIDSIGIEWRRGCVSPASINRFFEILLLKT